MVVDYFELMTRINQMRTACIKCGAYITPQEVKNGTAETAGYRYDEERDRLVPEIQWMHVECRSGAV